MILGIVLGFVCALSWALADVVSNHSLKRCPKHLVFMIGQFFGGLIILVFALLMGEFKLFLSVGWVYLMITCLCSYLGGMTFYESLKNKGMSLSLPIVYAWVLVTVFLSLIFYDEYLTFVQWLGVALIVSGIFVTTFHKISRFHFDKTFVFALLAAVFFGVELFLFKLPVSYLGAIMAPGLAKLIVSSFVVPTIWIEKLKFPKNGVFLAIVLIGFLDAAGFVSYSYGITLAPVSIVALITSTTPIIGVLAGLLLYKEKVTRKQALGVLVTLLGLIAVAL